LPPRYAPPPKLPPRYPLLEAAAAYPPPPNFRLGNRLRRHESAATGEDAPEPPTSATSEKTANRKDLEVMTSSKNGGDFAW